jgi:hypothetical protein
LDKAGPLPHTIAKASNHSLFESGIRFFSARNSLRSLVHIFFFLKRLAAISAFDEMGVKRITLRSAQLTMKIGRQQLIDLFVNSRHRVS